MRITRGQFEKDLFKAGERGGDYEWLNAKYNIRSRDDLLLFYAQIYGLSINEAKRQLEIDAKVAAMFQRGRRRLGIPFDFYATIVDFAEDEQEMLLDEYERIYGHG